MSTALLTAPDCQIWPYARGMYPPGTVHSIWQAMHEEDALRYVMYDAQHQDLETFVQMIYQAALFIVTTPEVGTILGAVWFTEMRAYRANIAIWYRRRFWGQPARATTDRICQFAFQQYGWATIWGMTPWRHAAHHGNGYGFHAVAVLPRFFNIQERWYPLYVMARENPALTEKEA